MFKDGGLRDYLNSDEGAPYKEFWTDEEVQAADLKTAAAARNTDFYRSGGIEWDGRMAIPERACRDAQP